MVRLFSAKQKLLRRFRDYLNAVLGEDVSSGNPEEIPFVLRTDSYKASHFELYPESLSQMTSYIEARTGGLFPEVVLFGLQYLVKRYLSGVQVRPEHIPLAAEMWRSHGLPFNEEGFNRIAAVHGGRIPVRIWAVPEGSVIPEGNLLVRIESTDPELPWLSGWIEDCLLHLWYPTTIATRDFFIKQDLASMLARTSDNPEQKLPFMLHDFGFRGASSLESGAIGGAARLVNFRGSDTMPANWLLKHFYDEPMASFSIPAMEHATVITWGRDHEVDAYRNALIKYARPDAVIAIVVDSYDIDNAVTSLIGRQLRELIKDSGATVVIRPDSGEPVATVMKVLGQLRDAFGVTENRRGFMVLNTVRVIQGDGVNQFSIRAILNAMESEGYSGDNIAFGMGGAAMQGTPDSPLNRDTQRFAMKPCLATVNGVQVYTQKQPKGDLGKASKAGLLDLVRLEDGSFLTVDTLVGVPRGAQSVLCCIFEDGYMQETTAFAAVRERTRSVLLERGFRV
jgi:nicotinamide phosphoribosyltransferase